MALKAFIASALLFLTVIFYLYFKEPYTLNQEVKMSNIPIVEFIDVKNYHITDKRVETDVKAKKVLRYSNRDEIYDIDVKLNRDNSKEQLCAKKALHIDGKLYLSGDVYYETNNSLSLKTNNLEYNLVKKILHSDSDFVLKDKRGIVRGKSLMIDRKNGKFKAQKIVSTIYDLEQLQ